MSNTIRLYDAYVPYSPATPNPNYTGRFTFTLDPFTYSGPAPGCNILVIPFPDPFDPTKPWVVAVFADFDNVTLNYVDHQQPMSLLEAGLAFDSDSPPAWVEDVVGAPWAIQVLGFLDPDFGGGPPDGYDYGDTLNSWETADVELWNPVVEWNDGSAIGPPFGVWSADDLVVPAFTVDPLSSSGWLGELEQTPRMHSHTSANGKRNTSSVSSQAGSSSRTGG